MTSSQIINWHSWLSENYNEEWLIPALLHMTLQNCKVTLQHHKLTKSKLRIFHTSFCVYILMKTKPLDANTSSAHANTSSMYERGSQPPACQGSVENTDDASPSSSDNTDKAAVPSDKDNANENDVPSNSDNSA